MEDFNFNWKDNKYRDAIQVKEKYSLAQKEYFSTPPKNRHDLIKRWLIEHSNPKKLSSFYLDKFNQDFYVNNFYII